MTVTHPDYAILAARIAVSNLHKQTKKQFSAVIADLYNYVNPKNRKHSPMISKETFDIVAKHAEELNSAIVYDRDFQYQYFGFKTLERSYLLRINGKVAERPQQMIMRVAVGIHGEDIEKAIETYNLMSLKYFTHASPSKNPASVDANRRANKRDSSLQRRYSQASAGFLLPHRHEGGQH